MLTVEEVKKLLELTDDSRYDIMPSVRCGLFSLCQDWLALTDENKKLKDEVEVWRKCDSEARTMMTGFSKEDHAYFDSLAPIPQDKVGDVADKGMTQVTLSAPVPCQTKSEIDTTGLVGATYDATPKTEPVGERLRFKVQSLFYPDEIDGPTLVVQPSPLSWDDYEGQEFISVGTNEEEMMRREEAFVEFASTYRRPKNVDEMTVRKHYFDAAYKAALSIKAEEGKDGY